MKHKLAVILVNGDFRIHGAGCRDIERDAAKSDGGAWYMEVSSRHEANTECWGEVAADNLEEGTQEWHDECDMNASVASRFLSCVPRSLPEKAEG